MPQLERVSAISNEDVDALPVQHIGPAVAYYETVLGFTAVRQDDSTAELTRDTVRIGLVRDPNHKPGEAGSLAFAVDDLDALHAEVAARGGKPGQFGTGEWAGRRHRTFFVREDQDGYCYCFYRPI